MGVDIEITQMPSRVARVVKSLRGYTMRIGAKFSSRDRTEERDWRKQRHDQSH